MKATRLRNRAARGLVAVVLGLLVAFVAVPASPAAASNGMLCFPINDRDGNIVEWHCIEIPVLICPPPCGPWAIDLWESIVLPRDVEIGYLDALGRGLELVGAAANERDPGVAEQMLDRAQKQFLASARILGGVDVELARVGFADLRGNQVLRDPSLGWLEGAGTDVGNGIWHMQAALSEPAPLPWIEAGMRAFSSASEHIAHGA